MDARQDAAAMRLLARDVILALFDIEDRLAQLTTTQQINATTSVMTSHKRLVMTHLIRAKLSTQMLTTLIDSAINKTS